MRLSFVLGSGAASALISAGVVVALFACGSDDGSSETPLPDGAKVIADGAIVDPDGNVIPPDVGKPSKVVVTTEGIDVLGTGRLYVLSVPKTYDATRSYPLIVALHGDGQNAAGFRTFLGLDETAGDDAIVANPDQALDLFTPYDTNADQQLVEAVINSVKAKFTIDAAKVWGFGYSKGAFMLNEIACRRPGVLKAMAAHATGQPQAEPTGPDGFPVCPGVVGLPVLTSQGSNDTQIGADFAAQYWAKVNGCGTSRSATTPEQCQKSDGCPPGKPVVFCIAPGVSHFPIWADAVQVSWDWFKSL